MADKPFKENRERAKKEAEAAAKAAKDAADEYERLLLASEQRSVFESEISKKLVESQSLIEKLTKKYQVFSSHHKEVVALYDKMTKASQSRSNFENWILNRTAGQSELTANILKSNERLLDLSRKIETQEGLIGKIRADSAAKLKEMIHQQGPDAGGKGFANKYKEGFLEAARAAQLELEILQKQYNVESSLFDIGKDISETKIEAAQSLYEAFGLTKRIVPFEREINELTEEKNRLVKLLNGENSELIEKYDDQIKMLKVQSRQTSRIAKLSSMVEPAIQRANEASGGLLSKFTNIGGVAGLIIGLISLPFIVGLKLAFGLFNQLDEAAVGFRQQVGLAVDQMDNLQGIAQNVAFQFWGLGVNFSDAYDAIASLMGTFSSALRPSEDLVGLSAVLARNYSVAGETSAGVLSTLMSMVPVTMDTAGALSTTVVEMSKVANVAPVDVFRDIAENSENIFLYMRGNVPAMVRAAVEARRMGTSLSQMTSTAGRLLDFQSSIESEMNASVLLSRHVNFGYARQLAFLGDIEGMQREVLNVVESVGDFTRMNAVEKKALAEAAGMEVGELHRLVMMRELMGSLTLEQREEYEKLSDEMRSQIDINKGNLGLQVDQLAEQQNQITRADALRMQWQRLGMQLSGIMLPVASTLYEIFGGWLNRIKGTNSLTDYLSDKMHDLSDWIRKINGDFLEWLDAGDGLDSIWNAIVDKLKEVGSVFTGIRDEIKRIADRIDQLVGNPLLRPFIGNTDRDFESQVEGLQREHGLGPYADERRREEEERRRARERADSIAAGITSDLIGSDLFDETRIKRLVPGVTIETPTQPARPGPDSSQSVIDRTRTPEPATPVPVRPNNNELVADTLLTQLDSMRERSYNFDTIDISDNASAGELAIVEKIDQLNELLRSGAFRLVVDGRELGQVIARATPRN